MGVRSEINRLFDSVTGQSDRDSAGVFDGDWAPAVDILENGDKVVVRSELPGLTEKDIEVDILGDTLTIKGEKKAENGEKDRHYHRQERLYGSFHRSIALPGEVAAEKAKASFKSGVLEIEVPKKEEAKPRQIKVDVK